jgi:hypothetical protein
MIRGCGSMRKKIFLPLIFIVTVLLYFFQCPDLDNSNMNEPVPNDLNLLPAEFNLAEFPSINISSINCNSLNMSTVTNM